jgi:hypothetical protein
MVVPTADKLERPDKWLQDAVVGQGVFVVTPSGMLLAGSHEAIHDARKAEKHIRQGLEKWENLSPAERLMSKEVFARAVTELGDVERRNQYPQDGLVLSVICRDLPRSAKPSKSPSRNRYPILNRYNLDYAWFRKGEARAFVPRQPIRGAKQEVPRELVERLARFHFVDLVRGHTVPFPLQAVEYAELTAEVVDLKGHLVSLWYEGRTRTSETHAGVHVEGKWNAKGPGIPEPQTRGVDAKLEGQAVFDLKAEKFVSFDVVVLCERWGGNAYNGRLGERDFGPAPMGIVLKLAGTSVAEQIAPLYVNSYGWK